MLGKFILSIRKMNVVMSFSYDSDVKYSKKKFAVPISLLRTHFNRSESYQKKSGEKIGPRKVGLLCCRYT